jgi:hypothetical protein
MQFVRYAPDRHRSNASLACRVDRSPLRDHRILVHELRDGRGGLGRAAFGCFLQQPSEFDVRLLLSLDR